MGAAHALSGSFMDLPGVKDAYDFVRAQWAKWQSMPDRMAAAFAKADELTQQAQAQGRPQLASLTGEALQGLTSLRNFWNSANTKLDQAMADVKAMGFGIVPLIVGAAVLAAAGAFYYVFRQQEYYEKILTDVEHGLLTTDQVKDLPGTDGGSDNGGGGLGGEIGKAVGKILIGGAVLGGGYLIVTQMVMPKLRARSARANPRRRRHRRR